MPVPSTRKQFRRQLTQPATPLGADQQLRHDVAVALSKLMQTVSGGEAYRHHKHQSLYRGDLENIRGVRLELVAQQQAARAREQVRQQGLIPVPVDLIRISWVWQVRFHVFKPKKQKKYWNDISEVVADSAEEVEQAVRFLCDRKGWELKQVLGAKPTSIAFSYHMDTLERLSKQQEAIVPWPAAFGQIETTSHSQNT